MFGAFAGLPDLGKVTEMAQKGLTDFQTVKNDVAQIKHDLQLIKVALNIVDAVAEDFKDE